MAKRLPTNLKVQLFLIGILIILVLSLIASQTASPDSKPLFSLKRVQEKVFLSLKSDPQARLDYMRSLLNIRLEELKSQVDRESYGYILPSSLRYSTLAGHITETIGANALLDQIPQVKEQFENHLKVLQEIYVIYPKNTDNVEYKYIEDDINYLKLYLDKLNSLN